MPLTAPVVFRSDVSYAPFRTEILVSERERTVFFQYA